MNFLLHPTSFGFESRATHLKLLNKVNIVKYIAITYHDEVISIEYRNHSFFLNEWWNEIKKKKKQICVNLDEYKDTMDIDIGWHWYISHVILLNNKSLILYL